MWLMQSKVCQALFKIRGEGKGKETKAEKRFTKRPFFSALHQGAALLEWAEGGKKVEQKPEKAVQGWKQLNKSKNTDTLGLRDHYVACWPTHTVCTVCSISAIM